MNSKNPSTTRVIVIDDDYISNFVFDKFVTSVVDDVEIIAYKNGRLALDKLIDIQKQDLNLLPDYIFVDVTMPVMNGWEFLEEYSRQNIDPFGKCKIYVLSCSLYDGDIKKAASNPIVQDYIIKPLDLEKLRNIFEADSCLEKQMLSDFTG